MRRCSALHLLDVKDGVAFHERDLTLDLFAVVIFFLLCG